MTASFGSQGSSFFAVTGPKRGLFYLPSGVAHCFTEVRGACGPHTPEIMRAFGPPGLGVPLCEGVAFGVAQLCRGGAPPPQLSFCSGLASPAPRVTLSVAKESPEGSAGASPPPPPTSPSPVFRQGFVSDSPLPPGAWEASVTWPRVGRLLPGVHRRCGRCRSLPAGGFTPPNLIFAWVFL